MKPKYPNLAALLALLFGGHQTAVLRVRSSAIASSDEYVDSYVGPCHFTELELAAAEDAAGLHLDYIREREEWPSGDGWCYLVRESAGLRVIQHIIDYWA